MIFLIILFNHSLLTNEDCDRLYRVASLVIFPLTYGIFLNSLNKATVLGQKPSSLFHYGSGNVLNPEVSSLGICQFSVIKATDVLCYLSNSVSKSSLSVSK